MPDSILVVNAGSSSIKFQLFAIGPDEQLQRRIKGQIEGIGGSPRLSARDRNGNVLVDESWPSAAVGDVPHAMDKVVGFLRSELGNMPTAIGHRVVHGGMDFSAPTIVDRSVIDRLDALSPLAPLHQPNNLAPIRTMLQRQPRLLQVACFDTAFHRGHPDVADRYAIPAQLHAEGVRRYGFHGLSYEYIAAALPEVAPDIAGGRVTVAHLGSGASMCALVEGRSVDCTLGFTALDGLPMGTRPGQLDPGVVLYLMCQKRMPPAEIERLLYNECGLKGLSGISNDMRDLLDSPDPRAKLAREYFVYRIVLSTGMLAAAMGGIDGLIFTAGIGENSPSIRAAVAQRLGWLGLRLDAAANLGNERKISQADSRIACHVIPTDEELMIARHTLGILRSHRGVSAA